MTSRLVGAFCALALGATAGTAVQAQGAYPDRPVRLVVGFPAGTAPDQAARVLAEQLQQNWGASVVVDNKPGAAGAIAAQEVARAAADGYTLFFGSTAQLTIAPSTYSKLPYDPKKDYAPIAQVASADLVFVTPNSVPAKSIKEYAQWAKGQSVFMGTFGAGTLGHFGAVEFADAVGVKIESVHYRNTGDALIGTVNGDVKGVFGSIALMAPQISAGKVRGLAVTGPERSPLLPEVPTFKEVGYPDLQFTAWFGVLAPAGTPTAVLDKANAEIAKAVQSAAGRDKLERAGFRVSTGSRQVFNDIIRDDTARWAKIVKQTGFKALD
ncbi:MAG: tripartite tricarboxylate transporter substrate binding protein [Rhodoferax sp.]|nr:tripartite tricarboxylate transporter substrate binding protein [Rhodoferax sp.]